jgi:hypothetical protein
VADYWNKQLVVTLILSLLSFAFWAVFRGGFTRRVIQLSLVVVLLYLLVNAVVIGSGIRYLLQHPEYLQNWWGKLAGGFWHPSRQPLAPQAWGQMTVLCLLSFPALSLGLSGFELSMVVMPLVSGPGADTRGRLPGRHQRGPLSARFCA